MKSVDTLLNKTTWFDFVSILIPGCALLLKVVSVFGMQNTEKSSGIINVTNMFPGAYIEYAPSESTFRVILFFLFAFALGILIHVVGKIIFDPILRNRSYMIKAAAFSVKRKLKRDDIPSDVKDYYKAYSEVVSAGKGGGIPFMEAQMSCLRSFSVILPLLLEEISFSSDGFSWMQTEFFLYPLFLLSLISIVLLLTSFVRLLCGIIPECECYPPIEMFISFIFIIFVFNIKSLSDAQYLVFSEFAIIAFIFYIQYSIHRLVLEEYPFCSHSNQSQVDIDVK